METTYVAALMGVERMGTSELVTLPMPEAGCPPKWLRRTAVQGHEAVEWVWEQWGEPDDSIYPYVFTEVRAVPTG